MLRNRSILVITIVVIIVTLGAFFAVSQLSDSTSEQAPSEVPSATEMDIETIATEATEDVATIDETEEPQETEESVVTETDDTTTATEEVVPGSEGGYSLTLATAELYTEDGSLLDNVSIASDEQHALITVSFLAEIASVSIDADDVILIDDTGNTYTAIEDGEPLNPYAVGAELTVNESLRGFVVFALPADTTPTILQWCPAGNCDATVEASVTINE